MIPPMKRATQHRIVSFIHLVLSVTCLAAAVGCQQDQRLGVYRTSFESEGRRLTVEVLDDDLVHFALETLPAAASGAPIDTTPMVAKNDFEARAASATIARE